MIPSSIAPALTRLRARLQLVGALAALTACLMNAVWLACMVYLAGFGDTAAQVRAHPGILRLSVGSCVLLTLAQVPILLAVLATAVRRAPVPSLLGALFYVLYISLNLGAYFIFGRLAPLVNASEMQAAPGTAVIASQIEIGGALAVTGTLPLLGYGVLGIGCCLLSAGLWRRTRLWSAAAACLSVSGLLSIVGAAGAFVACSWLERGSLIGGIFSLPALALCSLALWRDQAAARAGCPAAAISVPAGSRLPWTSEETRP